MVLSGPAVFIICFLNVHSQIVYQLPCFKLPVFFNLEINRLKGITILLPVQIECGNVGKHRVGIIKAVNSLYSLHFMKVCTADSAPRGLGAN